MSESLADWVREECAGVAQSGLSNDHKGEAAVAEVFGYPTKGDDDDHVASVR
jgi:hypothetical protein